MAQPHPNTPASALRGGPGPGIESGGRRKAFLTDWLFRNLTLLFALTTVLLILGIAIPLSLNSRLCMEHAGYTFFTTAEWDQVPPGDGKITGDLYGVLPFIYGTVVTSALAMLIAAPLGLGAAIFLAEIAPPRLSTPLSFLIELLAAVPSIVYGFAALKYLSPVFQSSIEPWLNRNFGQVPFFALPPGSGLSGQDFFIAGAVLAVMILPFMTAVTRDVLRTVPASQREAAYGLGATRWEAIHGVVLRYGSNGIIGAAMLALGRAVGETMAVTFVIGNAVAFPRPSDPATLSFFRPGYTMPAVLANQYPSPNSDLHLSALILVALTLFFVTVCINAAARGLVWLTQMQAGSGAAGWQSALKTEVNVSVRWLGIGLLVVLFVYQIARDMEARGPAGLVGLALAALTLFNLKVVTTRFFLPWRRFCNLFALGMCVLCALLASAALLSLFFFVMRDGIGSLNVQFFLPPNAGEPEKGGILHAIIGTGLLLLMASSIGIPIGILGGLYLSEFGDNRIGAWTRFAADLLSGVPSIVIGFFAFTLIVKPTSGNFGLAGGFALGVMMIPTIMRTTEELVRLVPVSLREGSLALGATHARTVWQVVLPAARSGIVTGVLLAMARVAGETAPLLIAVGSSSLFVTDVRERLPSLPMTIYTLADRPSELAQSQSWGAALVLVMLVLIFSILARITTRDRFRQNA